MTSSDPECLHCAFRESSHIGDDKQCPTLGGPVTHFVAVVHIREMWQRDLEHGFLDCLKALSDTVGYHHRAALSVFCDRSRMGIHTYVALVGEEVVGTASLFLEIKFIHNCGTVGHIEDVAVHSDRQHNGVGAALVQHLVEVCRREGCYKVILDCADDVIPFYEKLGFRCWETAMRIDLEAK